jgi:hypothetical protein
VFNERKMMTALVSDDEAANRASRKARYRRSLKGRAADARYKHSAKGKVAQTKYKKSEKGKAAAKRYRQSEVGRKAQARALAKAKSNPATMDSKTGH